MLKLTEDSLDNVDEKFQELYEQDGDKFKLKVEGLEDTTGLKNKVKELLDETKSEREKRQALEKAQKEAEEQRAKEKGEFKNLYEQTLKQLEDERTNNQSFVQKIQQRDIEHQANRIANDLARTDTKRAQVLSDYAARLAKFKDDQVIFEIGGIEVEPDKVKEHLAKEYPFLVDGSPATGSGAAGSKGGARPDNSLEAQLAKAQENGNVSAMISLKRLISEQQNKQ